MFKKVIVLLVIMLLLGLIAVCGLAATPQTVTVVETVVVTVLVEKGQVTANSSFSYPVRVQAKGTGEHIPNAKITIEVIGKAPLDEVTDANGFARVFIDADRVGQPSKLIVQVTGYKQYIQNIDLTEGSLPDVVQLEPASSDETASDAETTEATTAGESSPAKSTDTPVPLTDTPLPPTATPIPSPTPITTTSPQALLSEGQMAIGSGLTLWAGEFCVLSCGDEVNISFKLKNITDHKIIIPEFGRGDFVITLDTGQKLYVYTSSCLYSERKAVIKQQPLNSQEEISWDWDFLLCEDPYSIPNSSKSFVILVPPIGERFVGAQWQGIIPR